MNIARPSGIPHIIGNEAAERFSYYGMKTILVVFMTQHLRDHAGALAPMGNTEATAWYHLFGATNYFFPLLGALLADIVWGKYRTIMLLSLVYCSGHLALALSETRSGLALGLLLIALGAGGIKPCVSAHVGDQFTAANASLLSRTFGFFYLAINIGAFISSLLTPYLLQRFGPSVAFGVPGLFMALATLLFWFGRRRFIAIPACGWQAYKRALISAEGRQSLRHLALVFLFVSVFWSLFDQTGSSWVLQAQRMDCRISLALWSFQLLPSQLQALNPLLILVLVPTFSTFIYPALSKKINITSTGKISTGLALVAVSFLIIAAAEHRLSAGETVSIWWQIAAYAVITSAEILVSITALEYAYTQAPAALKSLLMSIYLLSVALGNALTAQVNFALMLPDGSSKLSGTGYFLLFTAAAVVSAAAHHVFVRGYKERQHLAGGLRDIF